MNDPLFLCFTVATGTHIDDAVKDLVDVSLRLNLNVKCDFNGRLVYVIQGETVEDVMKRYRREW